MAKEETRLKIMKTAELLFSKNGFDGVSTKTFAKEAGITEMTLFNHCSNKELLYKTVVKERYLTTEIASMFTDLTYDNLEKDLFLLTDHLISQFYEKKLILLMR